MDKITREELLEIASKTKLQLAESDIEEIRTQLSAVLEYAASVEEIAKEITLLSNKNVNHNRNDHVVAYDSEKILKQAPQSEDSYFVVPKILDN